MNTLIPLKDLNLEDFEPVFPEVPANETPRQFIQRMTGHDFPDLEIITWEHVREDYGIAKWFTNFIARFSRPQIMFRRKS